MEPIVTSAPASATPILDLLEPLPGKPRRRRLRGVLVGLVGGILFGGLLIAMDEFHLPGPFRPVAWVGGRLVSPVEFWDRQFFLSGLVTMWAAFAAAVVVHELGHFVVGRLVGFRLHILQLGPVSIGFDHGNLRVRRQTGTGLLGFAAMHVPGFSRAHRKVAKFIAGGPATSLLSALVAAMVLQLFSSGINPYLSSSMQLFAIASLFAFLISILPYRGASGYFTDGARLKMLLFPNAATKRWYALLGLGIQQRAGRRARDWNRRWLEVASANWDGSRDALMGTWLAYAAANDGRGEPVAAAYLERCLRAISTTRQPFRDILLTEASVFQSWFHQDASKAAAWFARVKKRKILPPLIRVRADVARQFVEGNFEAASREWAAGLAIIESYKDVALRERARQSWLEWKTEMEERRVMSTASSPTSA
jgi:hypothetical protein